jgi:hypothetical protein
VADTVKLQQHLGDLEIEDLAEVKTFLLVEQLVASRLRDRVLDRFYPRKSAHFSPLARVVAGFLILQIFHFVAMHMKYEALPC